MLAAELREAGKDEWARQEFDALRGLHARRPHRAVATYVRAPPGARPAAARRGPRAVGGPRRARPLPRRLARPDHRRQRDRGRRPGEPATRSDLLSTKGFHGRGAAAVRRPLARRPDPGARHARGGAARCGHRAPTGRRPRVRGPSATRSPPSGSTLARDGHGPALRGAPGTGREPAVTRHGAPGDVGAGRGRRATRSARSCARSGRADWQVELTAPMLADAITAARVAGCRPRTCADPLGARPTRDWRWGRAAVR